ncbi:MAG: hypothetical protein LBG16_04470 [Elusimicrobiota bacterium]|jgi:hypothetical protein|nr:hypothetical protein [Elusimicrobiota bacterium]
MTKKYYIFFLLTSLLLPCAHAQEKKHNFAVALETAAYSYKEPKMSHSMRLDGQMYGVFAEYLRRGLGNNGKSFFSADILYMTGSVDYDGWLYYRNTGTYSKHYTYDITDWFAQTNVKFGADLGGGPVVFAPYIGLGLRYLMDESGEKGNGGYDRTSTYFYMPLGMNIKTKLGNGWALAGGGEFDWFLFGKQTSALSQLGLNDLTNQQSEGYGAKVSLRVQKSLKKTALFFEPFFRYWHIQESDESYLYDGSNVYIMVEPQNETLEWGLKAGIYF